jgi:hypothetical protein
MMAMTTNSSISVKARRRDTAFLVGEVISIALVGKEVNNQRVPARETTLFAGVPA